LDFQSTQNTYIWYKAIQGTLQVVVHYVIKFVSDLRQVSGFLQVLWVSSTNKTDSHDITEILLTVALNTITITSKVVVGWFRGFRKEYKI